MHDEQTIREAAQRISELPCHDRMKGALALVAQGTPYREAAEAQGYADHRDVYRWAKRAGRVEVHSEQLVASFRRISELSSAEIERRLVEEPKTISTKDLAVIAGISADKIAKAERWGSDGDDRDDLRPRWLEAVSRILDQGGAALTISVEPPDTE